MRQISFLCLVWLASCGQRVENGSKDEGKTTDLVDYYDRFDLANTIDTTNRTYKPRVDSTYIYPADSGDITSDVEYSGYKIQTTIFPVKNKYLIIFSKGTGKVEKINFRDYKLQIDILDTGGRHIKRVITKFDFPDSIVSNPKYEFIRAVEFKGLVQNEFRFDIKLSTMTNAFPSAMIKCFLSFDDSIRFEDYPESYYDSLYQF